MSERVSLEEKVKKLLGEPVCGCCSRVVGSFRWEKLKYIGNDDTNGRYAYIELLRCKECQRYWLDYSFDYTRSYSGRWFRGIIPENHIDKITVENAAAYLENLDWYMGGGSHFEGKIYYQQGAIDDN